MCRQDGYSVASTSIAVACQRPSAVAGWSLGAWHRAVVGIGGLLLVVDVWNNPTALQRAW